MMSSGGRQAVRSIIAIGLSIAWLTCLCVARPALAQQDAADRAAIESVAQAWARAFNSRDSKSLLALATEDVVLVDPSLPPASGPGAREAWKKALAAAKGQIISDSKEIVIAGDVAWRIAAFTHRAPSGEVLSRGQSLEIWKRVGGGWMIHRQMSSSVLTRSPQPQPPDAALDRPTN